jgi:hypothetical protein
MTLEYEIDSIDGVDESISKLYIEKDGKYILDVQGHEKTEHKNKIPISRLNQEIEKRKTSEKQLQAVAEQLIEDVPEDKRSIIPDLTPAKKIAWLKDAAKMGFFDEKTATSLDATRPGDKSPTDFKDMNPTQIMSMGYKK